MVPNISRVIDTKLHDSLTHNKHKDKTKLQYTNLRNAYCQNCEDFKAS